MVKVRCKELSDWLTQNVNDYGLTNSFVMCDLSIGFKFCFSKQYRYLFISSISITVNLLLLTVCLTFQNANILTNTGVTPIGTFERISSGPMVLCLLFQLLYHIWLTKAIHSQAQLTQ